VATAAGKQAAAQWRRLAACSAETHLGLIVFFRFPRPPNASSTRPAQRRPAGDGQEEFCYYMLLAQVVSRVSGESFEHFTKARLFEPLGMEHTHFRNDHG
jgi:hypothetical protein